MSTTITIETNMMEAPPTINNLKKLQDADRIVNMDMNPPAQISILQTTHVASASTSSVTMSMLPPSIVGAGASSSASGSSSMTMQPPLSLSSLPPLGPLPSISRQSSDASTSSVIITTGDGDNQRVFPIAADVACPSPSPPAVDGDGTSSVTSTASQVSPTPVQGTRLEKEQFMEFTKILMKYLQFMNPSLCKKAQILLVQYSDRHRRQEIGYENLSVHGLKQRLHDLVGDAYWTRVEAHYKRYMKVQRARQRKMENVRLANAAIGK